MAAKLSRQAVLMYIDQNVKSMVLRQLRLLFHDIQKRLVVLATFGFRAGPAVSQPHNVQAQVLQDFDVLLAKR